MVVHSIRDDAGLLAAIGFLTAQTQTISDFPNYSDAIKQDKFDLIKMALSQIVVGLAAGFTFETVIRSLGGTKTTLPSQIASEE